MSQDLDQSKLQAFGGLALDILNKGALAVMMSVGHRTGLFECMAGLPPANAQTIANAAGLNQRYVREWLGTMVTGKIVDYDARAGTFTLPPEHAASLTRAAGPGNLAVMMQFESLMGAVEDDIVECFRRGGGVPYAKYPTFQKLMAEMSADIHDAALFDGTLPLVDGIRDRLMRGIDVCDVGCGQGWSTIALARAYPAGRATPST